ncbi:GNAT family N-acetyltransferase [Desertibacillus haloalkaliphilus]|uniref:GNAT family N-acetyltransferase n=1 Tax=Desertibacillus haloalkaliphilus TaxID=1328930 RepID=UPI001C25B935|nr:GNAT family N-acetyltransferase [Desertibacillus haloalkaliphilus]MBU8906205.1 GNAT family N-acetyltransferase [Desertibacillus haloalkaliphilus]
MNTKVRELTSKDYPYFAAMDTAVEGDYIGHIFDHLTTGNHRLFGLFENNEMISMGGYSIFAGRYAMLGRLRSDRRYWGKNYATDVLTYVLNEARKIKGVCWIGANTQEHNLPAQRVVEKLGLSPYITLHGAVTKDISKLESGANLWTPVHSTKRKKYWLNEVFIQSSKVFPYECYYPFPASEALFPENEIEHWSFYENESKTRVLITKYDQKKDHYLHVVYPWCDFSVQKGLWDTITFAYRQLTKRTEGDTYIWIDFTKKQIQALLAIHPFEIPPAWILYGGEVKN